MVLGGMLTLKAPMLEAYAGFKWVMFHMVFLMEPFMAQVGPKGPALDGAPLSAGGR